MNADIEVRKITDKQDLQKAFSIRRTVFVDEQHCPPELEWEHDEVSHHFLALFQGIPAGAARWRKTDNGYKLERFAVLKTYRNKNIGAALVKAILHDLPADAHPVYLHAQITAVGFYTRLGFRQQEPSFEEAGIVHYKMIRTPD